MAGNLDILLRLLPYYEPGTYRFKRPERYLDLTIEYDNGHTFAAEALDFLTETPQTKEIEPTIYLTTHHSWYVQEQPTLNFIVANHVGTVHLYANYDKQGHLEGIELDIFELFAADHYRTQQDLDEWREMHRRDPVFTEEEWTKIRNQHMYTPDAPLQDTMLEFGSYDMADMQEGVRDEREFIVISWHTRDDAARLELHHPAGALYADFDISMKTMSFDERVMDVLMRYMNTKGVKVR